MCKVLGIGDNVGDIYISSNEMFPGGQALNFAVYSKMLGGDSAYMGVFGRDAIAKHLISTLDLLEIDHKYCRQFEGENGYAVIKIINGDRVFVKSNRGGIQKEKPIVLDFNDKQYIKTFDLIHTSNNSYLNHQLQSIHELGVPISYDFSYKWKDWETTKEICPYIDFGFISCSSSMSMDESKEICKKIHELGCRMTIATMGGKGAWLYDGEAMLFQQAKTIEAIDTLGAGDSFAASFLIHFLRERKMNLDRIKNNLRFRESLYKSAMDKAATFAADTCLLRGAFGHGIEVPKSINY
ncbi:PfkB family carbohydrate kinase [Bacillus salipaludis]|uniref:PfkB family carbohydrate kinase n=1 Tax=Bacillus salipaludis TaxID=2547811 RepID=A0ABW8RMQ6_9BACI